MYRWEYWNSYQDYERDHIALDAWSVNENLEKILDFGCGTGRNQSQYYAHYSEEANTLSNCAADLWNELESLLNILGEVLPLKKSKFYDDYDFKGSGIVWFNYAISLTQKADMALAFYNEGRIYNTFSLEYVELYQIDRIKREKRQQVVARLPKKQLNILLFGVYGFLARYMEISAAFVSIQGIIDEMDAQQAMVVKDDGTVILHDAAYL